MNKNKEAAIALRKTGKSYREIEKELKVARSTLSFWLKKESWSKEIGLTLVEKNGGEVKNRMEVFQEARNRKLKSIYENARAIAKKEFSTLKHNPLFVAALSIYLVQGDKSTKYFVRTASAQPQTLRILTRFLVEVCGIPEDKIHYHLTLNTGQNEQNCKDFWVLAAKIPLRSFTKSTFNKKAPKLAKRALGVCTLTLPSRYMKEKMLVWLRLLANEFAPIEEKS